MFSLEIETLARLLVDEARSKSLRIVTAESCTGGLVAAAICNIPGRQMSSSGVLSPTPIAQSRNCWMFPAN